MALAARERQFQVRGFEAAHFSGVGELMKGH